MTWLERIFDSKQSYQRSGLAFLLPLVHYELYQADDDGNGDAERQHDEHAADVVEVEFLGASSLCVLEL